MRATASLVLLVACTRPAATATEVVEGRSAVDAGAAPASVVDAGAAPAPLASRGACRPPSRLVSLGTVHEEAHFEGDVLVGEKDAYDPETLAVRAKSKHADPPRSTVRYAEMGGGVGIVRGPEWPTATLEDTATKKVLRVVETCGAAGGPPPALSLSMTGRFLICHASRTADFVFETRSNKDPDPAISRGPNDVSLAPDDRYAIVVPVRSWLTLEPTGADVLYFDLDARSSKPIAHAEPKVATNRWDIDKNSFGVSFCGTGELFAMSLDREVVVYRGADGARLASAPATKGRGTSFDAAGRYVSQTRGDPETGWATTVFRLVP